MGLLDRARGELDDALVVVGAGALLVLVVRDAEQQHRGDAERRDLARLLDRRRDRQAIDTRHRLDRTAAVEAGLDEQRHDEVARVEPGLAHEVAQDGRLTQPAKARLRERHDFRVRPPRGARRS